MRDDREERDVRKNLPPLLTAAHTQLDAVFSRFYAAAGEIRHSAWGGGFLNGESVFSFPFGPQFDLNRDGDGCGGAAEGRTARLLRTLLGENLVSFDSDFRDKFTWF